jgi:GNAT superfamily N-acetyltransferase
MLVAACEAWARRCGLTRIRVRSRVARKDAHRFYEGLGFERSKEQVVFDKTPEAGAGTASVPRRERLDG